MNVGRVSYQLQESEQVTYGNLRHGMHWDTQQILLFALEIKYGLTFVIHVNIESSE